MAAAVLVVVGYFGWHLSLSPKIVFGVDDAYITQHNARALLQGSDPNFAEATPLHGATSALHLTLVAALGLVLPLSLAQLLVGFLAAIAFAAGLVVMARRLGASPASATLVTVATLACGELLSHLVNGLETGLSLALLTWTFAEFNGAAKRRRWSIPILLGLLPFARPEFAALSALLGLVYLWQERPVSRRFVGLFLVRAMAAAAPFALWYLACTGAPWPSTVNAKKLFYSEACWPLMEKLQISGTNLSHFVVVIGPLAAGLVLLVLSRVGRACLIFVLLLVAAYALSLPGALQFQDFRYLYVFVPAMALGFSAQLGPDARGRWPVTAFLMVAIAVSLYGAPARLAAHARRVKFTVDELDTVADWTRSHLPPGARILMHDAGRITIDSPFAMVDIVGLKTPSNTAVHRELTWPHCGGQGLAAAYISEMEHCDYAVFLESWDQFFGFTRGLRALGWTVARVDGARGPTEYKVYHLTPPARTTRSAPE
jgi:hypothetical protein